MRNIVQVINPAKVMVFITGLLFTTCLLLASSVVMLGNIIKSYESHQEDASDLASLDKNYSTQENLESNIVDENIDEVTDAVKDHRAFPNIPRYRSTSSSNTSSTGSFKAVHETQLAYNNNQFVILPSKKFNTQNDNQMFGGNDSLINVPR